MKDKRTIKTVSVEEIREILLKNERIKLEYMNRSETAECPICNQTYTKAAKNQKFCSANCKAAWHKIKLAISKSLP